MLERGELEGKQRLGRWVVSRQGLHHLPNLPEPGGENSPDRAVKLLEGEVRELRERLDEALERIEALEVQAPNGGKMRDALTPLFRGHD